MLTREGADSDETIIRPIAAGGFRIELPASAGISVAFASSEVEAVILARHLRPMAAIRVLPARDDQLPVDTGRSKSNGASDLR